MNKKFQFLSLLLIVITIVALSGEESKNTISNRDGELFTIPYEDCFGEFDVSKYYYAISVRENGVKYRHLDLQYLKLPKWYKVLIFDERHVEFPSFSLLNRKNKRILVLDVLDPFDYRFAKGEVYRYVKKCKGKQTVIEYLLNDGGKNNYSSKYIGCEQYGCLYKIGVLMENEKWLLENIRFGGKTLSDRGEKPTKRFNDCFSKEYYDPENLKATESYKQGSSIEYKPLDLLIKNIPEDFKINRKVFENVDESEAKKFDFASFPFEMNIFNKTNQRILYINIISANYKSSDSNLKNQRFIKDCSNADGKSENKKVVWILHNSNKPPAGEVKIGQCGYPSCIYEFEMLPEYEKWFLDNVRIIPVQ